MVMFCSCITCLSSINTVLVRSTLFLANLLTATKFPCERMNIENILLSQVP